MPDSDERLFSLLDEYVEQVQRGEQPDRQGLLKEHPELASALNCIEALESLAPEPKPTSKAGNTGKTSGPDIPTLDLLASPGRQVAVSVTARAGTPPPSGGAEFGDYEILAELGRGGMGVVYRARQKSLDRTVALKMILANHLATQDQVRRFQTEAKAAAGLSHSHIVNVYEVGQVHGQHYFAMQYVPGASLSEQLARGGLETDAAVKLLIAVASAVEHLHQHGIVHRDLKPSNILIDAEGRPYVTDFGLAKMLAPDAEHTATGVVAGTPSYMAPEQAWPGMAPVGPAADVYSLGAILYEMLTGRPPFREDNPLDTLIQVREREPPLPRQLNSRVPRKLELICLKCLEKSPEARYASAAALASDLEHYLKDEELEVRPPHGLRRLARWGRRQPALALRVTALAAFYLVLLFNGHVLSEPDVQYEATIGGILAVWIAASVLFQQLLNRGQWPITAIFAWAAVDVMLLTAAMKAGSGVASPALSGYTLLIVGSGLWFRLRLVWFTVGMCVLSYLALLADAYRLPESLPEFAADPVRHMIFVVTALLLGAVTTYQVARIRALSRYYEHLR